MAISAIVRIILSHGRMRSVYYTLCDQAGAGDNIVARFVSVLVYLTLLQGLTFPIVAPDCTEGYVTRASHPALY